MLYRILCVIALVFFVLGTWSVDATADETRRIPQSTQHMHLSFAPLVKRVAPAVVNIYTKRTVSKGRRSPFMHDPFFEQFFGHDFFGGRMRQHVESALGSGAIVSEDGLVITNAHVVQAAEEITVILPDGHEYAAAVILLDDASDLALLRIHSDERSAFPFVTLKPSETLEVGDLVLAIGNPFGVGQTVTSGIVSAQGRSALDINDYNFFIQTDAAINPGNSGGPLVAMDGGVVGINTAIYSRSGGSMGIGFSIPSEMVASVIAAAVNGQTGKHGIIRPWLGVQVQDVTGDIASSIGLERPAGALIAALHPASPIAKAGVQVGDVVLSVNGHDLWDAAEMKFRMATVPMGKRAEVTYFRGGKQYTVTVQAIAPPDDPSRDMVTLQGQHILQGITLSRINPAVSVELGLSPNADTHGVVVTHVPRQSYAARVIAPGDIMVQVNDTAISNPKDVEVALSQNAGRGVRMVVKRGGRITQIVLR